MNKVGRAAYSSEFGHIVQQHGYRPFSNADSRPANMAISVGEFVQEQNPYWVFGWGIFALFIPAFWMVAIRQRRGKMVFYYLRRIYIIDTILRDRA